MESERHAFMRKLLQLCVDSKLTIIDSRWPDLGPRCLDTEGHAVITGLEIDINKKEAIGFWDGQEHRVWL
jgi:hypothetical protein